MLIPGRTSRENQQGIPQAFIIGDRNFRGDAIALEIKEARAEEELSMHANISPKDIKKILDEIAALTADEDTFKSWKKTEADRRIELWMKEKKESVALKASLPSESQSRVNKVMDGNRGHSILTANAIIGKRNNPVVL